MRTRAIWIGVVLILCTCGLAVSQALSLRTVGGLHLAWQHSRFWARRPGPLRARYCGHGLPGRCRPGGVPPGWSKSPPARTRRC